MSPRGGVDALPFTSEQRRRQQRLFETTIDFLGRILRMRRVDLEALDTYAREVSLDVERNIRDAGRAQAEGLHQQMLVWRTALSDAQWCRIRFVIRGFQQLRAGHTATQYFAALVNDAGDGRGYPGESERVAYREDAKAGEHPWDPEFDLLATLETDARASHAIFADPDRLAVDVAAHGARERIRELDFRPLSQAYCYR